mgnify:CR=1 FL=1
MLPVLLTVLALAVWVLVCVNAQLRCVDAARAAARVAARGERDEDRDLRMALQRRGEPMHG